MPPDQHGFVGRVGVVDLARLPPVAVGQRVQIRQRAERGERAEFVSYEVGRHVLYSVNFLCNG